MAIRQIISLATLFLIAAVLFAFGPAAAAQPGINVIEIKDSINPGVQEFVEYAIRQSESEKAEFLVILLDTPGGLMTSMRAICQFILNSQIPIVVYVYPSGARAASAGVFITEAADIAAMAPGTNIGAAHPVSDTGTNLSSTMNEKVLNDALAFARSIAAQRGRNAQWFQEAVRKSVSASAQEAFKLNVIDLVADNLPSLLKKLDGWHLRRGDATIVLKTAGARLRTISPTWQNRFLQVLGDPSLAYLLLMIGLAGLYFELSRPGAIVPGVVGGVSLILALFAMQTLPVDYAGILIIILGLVFFIIEVKIPTHGAISLIGVGCVVLGSLMLFRTPADRVPLSVLLPTSAVISFFFAAVARLAFKSQATRPQTGQEALLGMTGKAMGAIDLEGKVFINGELWNALAEERIEKGEWVEVLEVHNLKLKVKRINGS
jgi:membrane-bound serine protease (ClpP class)